MYGYFLNIPKSKIKGNSRNIKQCVFEPIFGRGCEEVAWSESYFLIVAILKVVALFLLFDNFIANKKDKQIIDSSLFNGTDNPLKGNKYVLRFAFALGVHLLIPIIATIVSDIINDES